jgi:hypothetical protein
MANSKDVVDAGHDYSVVLPEEFDASTGTSASARPIGWVRDLTLSGRVSGLARHVSFVQVGASLWRARS